MKLSKAEITSIVITVMFIFLAASVTLWDHSSDSVTVSFENMDSADDKAMASPAANAVSQQVNVPISPININTATVEELCSLPGIGEVLAGKITEYRGQNGQFKSIDEIMNVSGIGVAKFEKIKTYITVIQAGGE